MTMWRRHLRYTLIALALGLVLSVLPWAGTAAPAKRSAPATPPAPAPTDAERALSLFKAKVEQFQRFLAQEPLALIMQDYSYSPTHEIYQHMRYKLLESGFDVQRSDSLVSPFIGYLNLTYVKETNGACGDLVDPNRQTVGYSTYEKAMAHIHDCFQRSRFGVENTRLTFAYQDGRWTFKDAIRTKHNDKDSILLAALGRPEPPWHRLADNQVWEALIK
jgi:hypothetical protein